MKTSFERDLSDVRTAEASLAPNNSSDSSLDLLAEAHGPFRNMCLVYGDFYRSVFLQEIINWFIRSASGTELTALRKAMTSRSDTLPKRGKRGRPRARDDSQWLVAVKTDAWRRIVEGRTWKSIAECEGLKPSRADIRTIERTRSRRQDEYAAIIWSASVHADVWRSADMVESNLRRLSDAMNTPRFRQWLWVKAALFGPSSDNEWVEGCKKIVLTLTPRGGRAAGAELARLIRYNQKKRQRSPS
jgi:hypothetical protein